MHLIQYNGVHVTCTMCMCYVEQLPGMVILTLWSIAWLITKKIVALSTLKKDNNTIQCPTTKENTSRNKSSS